MTTEAPSPARVATLRRRGFLLEGLTLAWNVVGVVVLAVLAIRTGSVATAGFGLDSLIEVGASTVVIWELSGTGADRQRFALRMIAFAFVGVAAYLLAQAVVALIAQQHPADGLDGILWTAVTSVAMFALAAGKTRTGRALDNPVLVSEGRVTVIDGVLALAVLIGLSLDAALGWWWADPVASLVIVSYAVREAVQILREDKGRI